MIEQVNISSNSGDFTMANMTFILVLLGKPFLILDSFNSGPLGRKTSQNY